MREGVQVIGADRLARTLLAAAEDLTHLDAATAKTSRAIQTRARTRTPKVSGRLASSLSATSTGTEAAVSSGVVYSAVIHYGWPGHNIRANPFLVPTAEETVPVWSAFFADDVARVVGQVKGK